MKSLMTHFAIPGDAELTCAEVTDLTWGRGHVNTSVPAEQAIINPTERRQSVCGGDHTVHVPAAAAQPDGLSPLARLPVAH